MKSENKIKGKSNGKDILPINEEQDKDVNPMPEMPVSNQVSYEEAKRIVSDVEERKKAFEEECTLSFQSSILEASQKYSCNWGVIIDRNMWLELGREFFKNPEALHFVLKPSIWHEDIEGSAS